MSAVLRMIDPQALGALAGTHELLLQLIEDLPMRDCNKRFDPTLPSAGWLLGRAVFIELHLLRGVVRGETDLADRVRHLFDREPPHAGAVDAELPPRDHLLNWANEVFDQHLTWLANPGQLPAHAWLQESWLVWHLAQREALLYEWLLAVLTARSADSDDEAYVVSNPLQAELPTDDSIRIEQGHYRVGARGGPVFPVETPPQVVELHAYRISRKPVSNAEYLAFIDDGGYRDDGWWDDDGKHWLNSSNAQAPWLWRRDANDHWYTTGVNGAMDLYANEPVSGLSAHEARAFAAWASARGQGLNGAVPQHEYQWEVAARLGQIAAFGRSWEWCANAFHHYPDFVAPDEPMLLSCTGETDLSLRGGCLHTQPSLRRTSLRLCGDPTRRTLFAGTRLVMPPGKAAWE